MYLLAFFEEIKKGVGECDPADNVNLQGRKILRVFPKTLTKICRKEGIFMK